MHCFLLFTFEKTWIGKREKKITYYEEKYQDPHLDIKLYTVLPDYKRTGTAKTLYNWFASLSLRGAAYVRRPVTTAICYDIIFSN